MTTKILLESFLDTSAEVEKQAKEFINLSYNQINWRTADSQWSIGECFEHLIRTNEKYIPEYGKHKLPQDENKDQEFKSTLLGKFVLKSVMPDYKRKFKTAASFNPIGSSIKQNIVRDFLTQNKEIINLAINIDHSKLKEKISSPFLKLVKYSTGDSFLIIANHNLRHIQQAKRVMENEKFPSS